MEKYKFIGDKELLKLVKSELKGTLISSIADTYNWITKTNQKKDNNSEIIATFVIDTEAKLRINDRHSEHIVCANGEMVLSAGEITFEMYKNNVVQISQITNQSTGYCPSVGSWYAVKLTLDKTNIKFPEYFTTEFHFRICNKCNQINVIKENYFVCLNCENELPEIED